MVDIIQKLPYGIEDGNTLKYIQIKKTDIKQTKNSQPYFHK
ncbi:MAG: hypothetical protein AAB893_01255 [Patescibacteria group bacterium]